MMGPTLKSGVALFLQGLVALLGLAVLAFLLWEPHVEGRNAHATLFAIYFQDPFLAYVYAGSIPFFVGLHRAFGLCGRFRRAGAFTPESVEALWVIRRCALTVIGFVAGGVVIILLFGDREDRPAGLFMSLLVAFPSAVAAAVAATLARRLQAALGKS